MVAVSNARKSVAAKFWLTAYLKTKVIVNPLQVSRYAGEHGIATITAETVAQQCMEAFPRAK